MFSYAQLSIINRVVGEEFVTFIGHSDEFYVNLLFDRYIYRPMCTHLGNSLIHVCLCFWCWRLARGHVHSRHQILRHLSCVGFIPSFRKVVTRMQSYEQRGTLSQPPQAYPLRVSTLRAFSCSLLFLN